MQGSIYPPRLTHVPEDPAQVGIEYTYGQLYKYIY